MTLYEALYEFEQQYLNALAVESKRVIDFFDQQWQTIDNEFACYNQAFVEGDFVAAQEHLDNILSILADNDLIVTPPVPLPTTLGTVVSPSTIPITCDALGAPTSTAFDNAFSAIQIYAGVINVTANWTFTIDIETNVTANIQNSNEVWLTAIAADNGNVVVRASHATYSDILITVTAYKVRDGAAGYIIIASPGNIMVPIVSSVPDLSEAKTKILVTVENEDDTLNWTFIIDAEVNCTASLVSSFILKIDSYSNDGYVDVVASKTGYDSVTTRVYVYGINFTLSDYYTKAESDGKYVQLTTDQSIAGEKTFTDDVFISNSVLYVSGVNATIRIGDAPGFPRVILQSGDTFGGSLFLNNFTTGSDIKFTAIPNAGIQGYFATGFIGIGTKGPTEMLHVKGNVFCDTGQFKTTPVEVYQFGSGTTVTPVATSNSLVVTMRSTIVQPTITELFIDLDNFEDNSLMPVNIAIQVESSGTTAHCNIIFRDSSNVTIITVDTGVMAISEQQSWGLSMVYKNHNLIGNKWHVLGTPDQSYQ